MTTMEQAPAWPSGRDFAQLTKLSISSSSTLTAAAGYLAASRAGQWGLLPMLLGTLLLAMGSSALNEVQEIRYDARMTRTRNRPLPAGRLSRRAGLAIALALAWAGFAVLLLSHGWVPALLGAA
jgi:protoheme IX farnesyltransferase